MHVFKKLLAFIFAASTLTACADNMAQNQPTSQAAYIAPAPGTKLGRDGNQITVVEVNGCILYRGGQNNYLFLRGPVVSGYQGFHDRVYMGLEKIPGGNACKTFESKPVIPLLSPFELSATNHGRVVLPTGWNCEFRIADDGRFEDFKCRR